MAGGKRAALAVLLLVGALVVATVLMSVDSWRERANPSVVNQPPATQGPSSTPAR